MNGGIIPDKEPGQVVYGANNTVKLSDMRVADDPGIDHRDGNFRSRARR